MNKVLHYDIGLDVGSTTVKAVVVERHTREIVGSDYRRHHTHQAETVLEILETLSGRFPAIAVGTSRIFITGSGATHLAPLLGARFIQEVNAVTLAVEARNPEAGSVIELGGQDAKIIRFTLNPTTGQRQSVVSMNDKCASGTGATIEKCLLKVGIPLEDVSRIRFHGEHLHHVAAKCGVFAETDIVNLVKSGVPAEEIVCSLADAIVMQNLSVLARGNTLRHQVVLLGGPNHFLPFLRECWQQRIVQSWRERGHTYPDRPLSELVMVPPDATLYAAYGSVLYGLQDADGEGAYRGLEALREFICRGRKAALGDGAEPPLFRSRDELSAFRRRYASPRFTPFIPEPEGTVAAYLGLDCGSTSSKCVLVDASGRVLMKCYRLSQGNPLQDMKDMLGELRERVASHGASLRMLGVGVTGYAADILEASLCADVNIVETVAHMKSAAHFFDDVDVICDVGGQDIKVLVLKNGDLREFHLSTQCSAGNGMLLQAMADQFGIPVADYADHALAAELAPVFSQGCAVFLDADRVNFQRDGFTREELMAGLVKVLPKNIWQYVVRSPRLSALGRRFVLQGGAHHNLAAVKAQVDYIEARVPGAEVMVHPHSGEAGAIGAALEAMRVVSRRGFSTFAGLDAAIALQYTTRSDASTQCRFCPNFCARTFVDTVTPHGDINRFISGFKCEKGSVEHKDALKAIALAHKQQEKRFPDLAALEASLCFRPVFVPQPLPPRATPQPLTVWRRAKALLGRDAEAGFMRSDEAAVLRRRSIRIGMPKVLNLWSVAPFFRAYFETLGILPEHVVFSEDTSESLYIAGSKYGSVDPCFPSKAVQAHIHHLLFSRHGSTRPLDYLFFPSLTHIPNFVTSTMDDASCPIVAGTPNVMRAAFTKEVDFFARAGVEYVDDVLAMNEPHLFKRQLFECWSQRLGITEDESDFAAEQGWLALDAFTAAMEEQGRRILAQLEQESRVGVLLLGRPYHNDPGINHEVTAALQALGFPILTIRAIPKDPVWLSRYFGSDLADGMIDHPCDIRDVWPENYSANSTQKVWAAKFAARHPNLAVLDLSSFKCGNDAPTYGLVESILSCSNVPYLALHDIDANKPSGSIKIRIQTFAHRLRLREEQLQDRPDAAVTPVRRPANSAAPAVGRAAPAGRTQMDQARIWE